MISVQNGNFSVWWENKQRKDKFAVAENEKHQKEIQKLNRAAEQVSKWADKNERSKIGFDPIKEHDRSISTRSYIGSKTKKMQSRVKQMEKRIEREIEEKEGLLQDIESPKDLKLVQLTHHKKTLVNVKDYSLRYKDSKEPVFEGMTFAIERGDRVTLSGKNGSGKTTIIRNILGKCNVTDSLLNVEEDGICEVASGLIVSYVGQETVGLKGNITNYCKEHNLDKSLFCSILRQLDFERGQFLKNMEDYSEGQKKKVLLATSLLTPAHIYIWDEPLNYIDVFSRMQLEKLILEYQPTMLFVEHDTSFCEQIGTKVIEL
jgi:lincosamide and streptogramin A transport system ATP-binding/permease protein